MCTVHQIVGQFAVYALFRSATLRSAPDKKVFDRLWRTQERLPMVVLWGKAVWTADMFLVEYAPIPDITLSRLVPKVGWFRVHVRASIRLSGARANWRDSLEPFRALSHADTHKRTPALARRYSAYPGL
jgi:hypothetical protein